MFSGFGKIMAQQIPATDSGLAARAKKDTSLSKGKISASIYPNPAKNRVEISVAGFEPGFIRLQLTNIKGNLVRNDQRLLLKGSDVIVLMFSLPAGIYFVLLRQNNRFLKKRLLIQ